MVNEVKIWKNLHSLFCQADMMISTVSSRVVIPQWTHAYFMFLYVRVACVTPTSMRPSWPDNFGVQCCLFISNTIISLKTWSSANLETWYSVSSSCACLVFTSALATQTQTQAHDGPIQTQRNTSAGTRIKLFDPHNRAYAHVEAVFAVK